MKIGYIEIENAYFSLKLLNSSNAFIGTVPLIDSSTQPEPALDYFYVELDSNSDPSTNWELIVNDSVANSSIIEYSLDKINWSNQYQNVTRLNETVNDTVSNIKKIYGYKRILPLRIQTTTSETIATNQEGHTSSIVATSGNNQKGCCFIMNNEIDTYTNGIQISIGNLNINIRYQDILKYLLLHTYCIWCNETASTGTNSLVSFDALTITATGNYIKNYLIVDKYDKVFFRAKGYDKNPINYTTTNYINIGGDIQTLFDYQNMNNETAPYLGGMFTSFSNIKSANNLSIKYLSLTENCYERMFQGCTSLTSAPELPATTLASSCYYYMFRGCSSLISAPELPATTLAEGCYQQMFNSCSSLNYIKCLATDISASNSTSLWVSNTSATGTFVKASTMSSWTTGNNGIPANWTVQDA